MRGWDNRWSLAALVASSVAIGACAAPAQHAAAPKPPQAAASVTTSPQAASTAKTTAKSVEKPAGRKLWGTVQSIDAAKSKLTIQGSTGIVHELSVAPDAPVTKGGSREKIQLADIKTGDKVTLGLDGTTIVDLHVNVIAAK